MPKDDRNTRARGPLTTRPPAVPPLVFLVDSVSVKELMLLTIRSKRNTDKFQCHGDSEVRFGTRAAAAARPRWRSAPPRPAGRPHPAGNPERPGSWRRSVAASPGADPGLGR